MIAPEELAQFRSEAGLNQREMADILNDLTGRHYTGSSVSAWERGHKAIPAIIQESVEKLLGKDSSGFNGQSEEVGAAGVPPSDTRPRRSDAPPDFADRSRFIPVPVPGNTGLEQIAVEMFKGIGQTIEMVGAFTGGPKIISVNGGEMISLLELDGRTIAADAETLGKAWAHLAATNAWVARILTSLTSGGAWVEVIMATSGTVFKVYKNHAGYNEWLAEQSKRPEPVPEPTEDGSVI